MLAPLSWLKEYVDITLSPKQLGERLTEIGLGVEKIIKTDQDIVFELEITPNRPDLLSIIGIAREIAAIEQKKISFPKLKTNLEPKKGAKKLPLTLHPNYIITPRITGIIINDVSIKESPRWLQERLLQVGQRPINNIVDITNFVMKELGNPIHAFDYHKIKGHEMWVKQAKGGEMFESVDGITYRLPKGAIIYEDQKEIFDLVGIKGGKNSGTYKDTRAVLIVVEVDDPILIRKASLALALRSDASAIFERSVNKNGTVDALKRTVDLVLRTAGGELASNLIDLKKQDFGSWKLKLRVQRLNQILGIEIPKTNIINILSNLHLSPKIKNADIECTIPTYRNDLQIEEDLIEEVARLYGYNNFPKTMPEGTIPVKPVPYFKEYRLEEHAKQLLRSAGFSESYTYSLVSESDLADVRVDPRRTLRIDNPVSREYEYLRPNLAVNLVRAIRLNKPHAQNISLFELGRIYQGTSIDECEELQMLAGISNEKNFFEVKGVLERLLRELGIDEDPTESISVTEEGVMFELNFSELSKKVSAKRTFIPLPKYPPIIEDLAFIVAQKHETKEIINAIKKASHLIANVELLDRFESTRTFHIIYRHPKQNLTNDEVAKIRSKILRILKEKFNARLNG